MSSRPHRGTVAETRPDAATDEIAACVRSMPVGNTSMLARPLVLVFLLACHTSSPSVTAGEAPTMVRPEPGSAPSPQQNDAPTKLDPTGAPVQPSSPSPPPAVAKPGIGETCASGDVCAPGLSCVSYYGIAGTRGPEFKSCEIRCETDKACPKGRTCVTVSDGPGRVCR
jgi:hypothetical protein